MEYATDFKVSSDCKMDNIYGRDCLLSIEWNIRNYKTMLQNERLQRVMSSPSFEIKDDIWKLVLNHSTKNVIPYLFRWKKSSKSKRHSISYRMSLQTIGGMWGGFPKTVWVDQSNCIAPSGFSTPKESLGEIMTSDNLRVSCFIFEKIQERSSEAISPENAVDGEIERYLNTSHEGIDILISNLKGLFLNEENRDIVIAVKDRIFRVHKAILDARCPVLSAMMQQDMTEKNNGTIYDCEPDVFERFLVYLYSGQVEELSWSNAGHLYRLGDKYYLSHLRKVCLQFMEDNLCVEGFCGAITLARERNESKFLKNAEEFFFENVKSILLTNTWYYLMKKNPALCIELFLKYNMHVDENYSLFLQNKNALLPAGL